MYLLATEANDYLTSKTKILSLLFKKVFSGLSSRALFLPLRQTAFSLPQSIEEVGGYVLIALNTASTIPLENLRIIRGHSLDVGEFALSVFANYHIPTAKATKQVLLNSLTGQSTSLFSDLMSNDFTAIIQIRIIYNIIRLSTLHYSAEILKGGVKIEGPQLCNMETIQWYDIVNADNKSRMEIPVAGKNRLCEYHTLLPNTKSSGLIHHV